MKIGLFWNPSLPATSMDTVISGVQLSDDLVGPGASFQIDWSIRTNLCAGTLTATTKATNSYPAVFPSGGQSRVFVVGADGRLALRDVEAGHRSATAVEILSGLDAGEVVVSHPRRGLSAGQRVSVAPTPD